MSGFFVYLGCAVLFYAYALYAALTSKPVGIWTHERKRPAVNDIKGYNRAVALLFAAYGTLLVLCGIPMLFDSDGVLLLLVSVLGVVLGSIGLMVGGIRIDQKFRNGVY